MKKRGRPVKRDRVRWRADKAAQPWDRGEWWDARARAVGGACGKCGGWLRGMVVSDMTGRAVVAGCVLCGSEKVLDIIYV